MQNDKRERLIELIRDFRHHPEKTCPQFGRDCTGCEYENLGNCLSARSADYLLKNDVVPVVKCCDCEHWTYMADTKSCFCDKHFVKTLRFMSCPDGIPRERSEK